MNRKLLAAALAAGASVLVLETHVAWGASAIIDNGTVQLGVNDNGSLIATLLQRQMGG